MKNALLIAILLMGTQIVTSQDWTTPIIDGYGKIKDFKNMASLPDPTKEYNVVFDLKDEREMEGTNIGYFKIARLINMLGANGISADKVHIVAAIHGGATFTALNNEKYKAKYEKENPNAEVIKLLKDYGVQFYVCAQATAARGIEANDLNPNTELGLSAMMVLANYQIDGYILMP
ncbi:Intracellular sulfur oxidation protein, DsrE/DsrF family [Maribacter sedimenticola]|uniref:Intracellular sulfur oxidation protein, DsrE/DsrF family n=1 Tax=Maribacter sedimenticola TaxID=228956 RepID=A0ABY1SFG4_9FLAO|nr:MULTISPECIES: DsrE family protein [Maribacter]TVZ14723.1 intracellular sulfur oxidation DsrE/DsrF family protein [Maribacter sp. MAR_2009_72]SNR41007.1 Intracellular sulfur oxidation protein, DsrE/DsrF family [Maribacter sedimenticola]